MRLPQFEGNNYTWHFELDVQCTVYANCKLVWLKTSWHTVTPVCNSLKLCMYMHVHVDIAYEVFDYESKLCYITMHCTM